MALKVNIEVCIGCGSGEMGMELDKQMTIRVYGVHFRSELERERREEKKERGGGAFGRVYYLY